MEFNFNEWIKTFQRNQEQYTPPRWEEAEPLTEEEKRIISHSIQQFQIGESSEGKNLIDAAKRFLENQQDQSYLEAIILFIKEEQRHAITLRTFMEHQGIPTIRKHWVDDVFRSLRRLAGLELSVVVLLTAELIAMVYYQALYDATQSQTLKQICKQILSDEEKHIAFQSTTLHKCWHHSHPLSVISWKMIRRILIYSTIGVVWCNHRSVLRAGGFSMGSFFRAVMEEYRRSYEQIHSQ